MLCVVAALLHHVPESAVGTETRETGGEITHKSKSTVWSESQIKRRKTNWWRSRRKGTSGLVSPTQRRQGACDSATHNFHWQALLQSHLQRDSKKHLASAKWPDTGGQLEGEAVRDRRAKGKKKWIRRGDKEAGNRDDWSHKTADGEKRRKVEKHDRARKNKTGIHWWNVSYLIYWEEKVCGLWGFSL